MSYHINPRTGTIRECKANKKPCPYADTFHGDTKQDAELKREHLYEQYPPVAGSLDEWLRPGGSSQSGFMGQFETYAENVAADTKTLAAYGTTPQEIGDLLGRFNNINHLPRTAARQLPKTVASDHFPDNMTAMVSPNFTSRGSQDCPFSETSGNKTCKTALSQGFVNLESPTSKIATNQLMSHLIREHGFFQGKQSEYRVDPAALAQMFGFKKQESLKPHTQVNNKLHNMRAKNLLPVTPKKLNALAEAAAKTGDGLGAKVGSYTIHQVHHTSEHGRTMNGHIILQKDGSDDIIRLPYSRTEPYDGEIFYLANPEHATLVTPHTVQRSNGLTYTTYPNLQ